MPLIDLIKHGRYAYSPITVRPHFSWPGGKRLALAICNNIEVFSFLSGLGSDNTTPNATQNTRNYAWRDYGNRVGQWYLFDLLDEYEFPTSHNINSLTFQECPQLIERIISRGDELIGHGRTNAERQDTLSEAEERALIAETTDTIRKATGQQPRGWMGPYFAQSPVTLDLLKEAGYTYVLDWPADDQPFWLSTRSGPLLSVPYSLEVNDSPAIVFRQHGATEYERMIIDQFDEMLLQSEKWPLVCTIITHPFVIGHPFRLRALRRAFAHIAACRDDVWLTTPGQVAAHFASVRPAA
ncbi:polysaccharide deacetylase family protein [Lichenifustis flavocetrariae]|uniref:Chitooligosaccharide deacetylase n=1 Tax=Lichenifustis flavocetrariae TaxID=2949735 RepID=A0AA42CQH1_9HYPH|nr:polysaccharide deacetylase family protein [Lichenifustis flavocetrariae]MCW6511447.1 polysaccharide deacetylase family protein [Lichenifustis flavocetrariae]